MLCQLNSWLLPSNVKNTRPRHPNVNWPITINLTNPSINLSIIKQAKIPILFISYLRISRIDFDTTSSDLVASPWICRMVPSASFWLRGSREKLRIKENEIWWQNQSKYEWHLGLLKKLKCHFSTQKTRSFSPQKLIVALSKSLLVPLKKWVDPPQKWSPTVNSYALPTQFVAVTFKCRKYPAPTFQRELTNHHKAVIKYDGMLDVIG
jgi:hypothetical protein